MRGEKFFDIMDICRWEGSPPHARGKVIITDIETSPIWDHPRMRGEKVSF